MADQNQQQSKQYQVVFNDDVNKSGVYSNVASVHVNNNEVVMDFGYMMPGSQTAQILVNSRVNMTHETAKSFISMLQNAMLDFQNKKNKSE
jgi:hypothetical protein